MERHSFRATAAAGALMLVCMGGPVGAQRQPTASSSSVPESLLIALEPVVVRIRADIGDQQEHGFGFVVAGNEKDVVLVTAAHVVSTDGALASRVVVTFDGGNSAAMDAPAEFLVGQENLDHLVLDLAFLVVHRSKSLPPTIGAPRDPKPGEKVWVLGEVNDTSWSREPGTVGDDGKPHDIAFGGIAVETGLSGAPLVTRAGVSGLVYRASSSTSYAIPLTIIRSEFVRRYAGQYQWRLAYTDDALAVGSVLAKRSDTLSEAFNASFQLVSSDRSIPLTLGIRQDVPAGHYEVRPAPAIAGVPTDVICLPKQIEVRAFVDRGVSIQCSPDASGDWTGVHSRLHIDHVDGEVYTVREFEPNGELISRGDGRLVGTSLRLEMAGDATGRWGMTASLASGGLKGRRTFNNTGAEEDLAWVRDLSR